MVDNNYNFIIIKVIVIATELLTVEMGVLTVEEKLIHVDMLRLEVGSKGLRTDVRAERETETWKLLKGLILWRADGAVCEKSIGNVCLCSFWSSP